MHSKSGNLNAPSAPRGTLPRRVSAVGLLAVALGTLASSVGCFNADALIEARRMIAMRTRLEEVDLGEFHVTLPNSDESTKGEELFFHVFCQVANRDLEAVEEALAVNGPEIRHRMLIAARTMTAEQLEDPELQVLRESFVRVVNESLKEKPVQSVGFYRFGYMNF
jgi:hypothetical protein